MGYVYHVKKYFQQLQFITGVGYLVWLGMGASLLHICMGSTYTSMYTGSGLCNQTRGTYMHVAQRLILVLKNHIYKLRRPNSNTYQKGGLNRVNSSGASKAIPVRLGCYLLLFAATFTFLFLPPPIPLPASSSTSIISSYPARTPSSPSLITLFPFPVC